jgi:hypothetical protein
MGEIHTSNNNDFKFEDAGIRIVRVHSDGGKEYEKLERLEDHLATYSAPYTPENNPISERGNRTLFDAARTLPVEADLPACSWSFAIKHVAYVRNRVRHATTSDSPYYMVTGEKPRLKNLKVFGCRAYVLILSTPSKFERRAEPGIQLECLLYGVYKIHVPSKDGGESKIITSRHVTFDEEELPGLTDMADTMDSDGASDSSYACKSIESSDSGYDSEYSDSESEYFDASSEHSSYTDYSSDGGPEKLVEPIAEDLDEEALDSDAEEGTPISEEASEITINFERFPGLSRTRNKPRSFWAQGTQNDSRTDIKITTSDSPTLREALSSTSIEQELWQQSIAEEMESL